MQTDFVLYTDRIQVKYSDQRKFGNVHRPDIQSDRMGSGRDRVHMAQWLSIVRVSWTRTVQTCASTTTLLVYERFT